MQPSRPRIHSCKHLNTLSPRSNARTSTFDLAAALPSLNQSQNVWMPHLRDGLIVAKVGMYTVNQPPLVVPCRCFCGCLRLFLRLLVLLQPTITNVISTEGGALCRRSGEIPVFCLCSCRCLFSHTCKEAEGARFQSKRRPPRLA